MSKLGTLIPVLCLRPSVLRYGSQGEKVRCGAFRRLKLAIRDSSARREPLQCGERSVVALDGAFSVV